MSWLSVTIEMRDRDRMRKKRWQLARAVVEWFRTQIQDADL